MLFRPGTEGVSVALHVTPKAASERIGPIVDTPDGGTALKIAVTAAPENGKANVAVIRALAKAWKLPRGRLSITQGATDRRKRLLITGDRDALVSKLEAWMRGAGL